MRTFIELASNISSMRKADYDHSPIRTKVLVCRDDLTLQQLINTRKTNTFVYIIQTEKTFLVHQQKYFAKPLIDEKFQLKTNLNKSRIISDMTFIRSKLL